MLIRVKRVIIVVWEVSRDYGLVLKEIVVDFFRRI